MEMFITILQILLYIAAIVLLVVFTIVGLKAIKMMDKADVIMDDAYGKIKTLDGLFLAIDKVSEGVDNVTSVVVKNVTKLISKIFKSDKKNKKKEDDIDE